jgi:diguanylate cyclase (GGDEF)-like protein
MELEYAFERAEALRSAVAGQRTTSGASVVRVTASFGVASFPQHGKTIDELIAAADSAMFAAKAAGRNQVACCGV